MFNCLRANCSRQAEQSSHRRDFMDYAKLRSGNENVSTNIPWRRVNSPWTLGMDFHGPVENLYRAERTKRWLSCKSCDRV